MTIEHEDTFGCLSTMSTYIKNYTISTYPISNVITAVLIGVSFPNIEEILMVVGWHLPHHLLCSSDPIYLNLKMPLFGCSIFCHCWLFAFLQGLRKGGLFCDQCPLISHRQAHLNVILVAFG